MSKITLLVMLTALLMPLTICAQVFSVAGTPKELFGSENDWDAAFTGTEMQCNDNDVYEWTSEIVMLPAGKPVQFKVVQDHSWDISYGKQGETGELANIVCEVNFYGLYRLKVTYEPLNDDLVTGELTLVEEFPLTYTVAGAPESLFGGKYWDAYNSDAEMQFNDETLKYEWTSDVVELTTEDNPDGEKGYVEFKVVAYHDWDNAYPGENYKIQIPENGLYSLKVSYDQGSDEVVGELIPATVEHTYSVAGEPKEVFGSENDWDATFTGTEMLMNDNNVYEWNSGQVELVAGKEVIFKVAQDHDWEVSYGKQGETGDAANMICTAEKHGLYTLKVTFDPENDNLVTGELILVEELPSTYTVVGAPAALFGGKEWDENNEAGLMQLNENGIYEWMSELAELTVEDNPLADQGPGHVEFKVIVDHYWLNSYPGANYSIEIPEDGKYTLKVTFDPQSNAITGVLVPEAVEHVYSVVGEPKEVFGSEYDWDAAFTGTEMLMNDNNVYEWNSEPVELASRKDVIFKVAQDHDWEVSYGKQGETGDAANMICTTEKHGIYTLKVTFDPENDNLVTGELILVEELPSTYTVVGAPAALFGGKEWDENNEAGLMRLNDNGFYVWTSELGELTVEDNPLADQGPGHVEFKIVIDHNWLHSYPGANYSIEIPEDGKYTLKVTFDPQSNAITGVLIPEGATPTYSVAGTPALLFGNEWDATNTATDMKLNEETNLYEWTSELTELTTTDGDPDKPGYVLLKIVENHDWNVAYPVNDNYDIVIPVDGNYTLKVTFNPEDYSVSGELILDDPSLITEIYMVGSKLNSWQWDTPEGRLPLTYVEEDGAFEVIQTLETGDEFKFIAPLVDNPVEYSDWRWFGGEDEAHVSNFWVTSAFTNGTWPIDMISHEGTEHNFLMCVTGTFKFTIKSGPNSSSGIAPRAPVGTPGVREPLQLIIKDVTSVTDLSVEKESNDVWFNLLGVKLVGKPSTPGIYINNGKKVVVR